MKARGGLLGASAMVAILAALFFSPWAAPTTLEVGAGSDLQEALDGVEPGATVVLGPGIHAGGVRIDKAVSLEGRPGARIEAPSSVPAVLMVVADGTSIKGLTVEGGSTGVVVREAERVTVRDVDITGADLHGVEVIDASARLSDVRVEGLRHPMAQGIEVRNSDGRPDSVVENSVVVGGQEGIVSHVSEVIVRNNDVTKTTMRGITITEMSDGLVDSNRVANAAGAGLYCGDMSRCDFAGNRVEGVKATSGGRSTQGWGLVVTYHAVASSDGDRLDGASGPRLATIGGHLEADSPIDPDSTWSSIFPIVLATLAALGVLLVTYLASRGVAAALARRPRRTPSLIRPGGVLPLVLGGLAIQTFHMAEHTLQVWRVRIDQIPSRGGIVGPRVEAEWIHFAYNGAVVLAIAIVFVARARGWAPAGRLDIGDRMLTAGLLVQGYHFVEHSAKLFQHIQGGAKVNPGFAGGVVDLVLLHFAVNLIVYLAMVGAALAYGVPSIRRLFGRLVPGAPPAGRLERV
ncbi:MAG TPA: right-handed parallel beta-helix repeat-containing protein [Actinomycetota bacterium]|nr:right-handed parallel beta-helix repeat-containing protein [Actinomycetota bacterium]